MGKKEKKEKNNPENILMQKAIDAGFKSLVSHPGLSNYKLSIRKNLDYDKIYEVANEIKDEISNKNIPKEKQADFFYSTLANYIASGNALNTEWKKIAMEKGYNGNLNQNALEKIVNFFKPHKFEGEKYFENATKAYGNLYERLAENKFAQKNLPEFAEATESLAMYGFLDEALTSFKAHGIIDDRTYKNLHSRAYNIASKDFNKGMSGIERYISSKEEKAREYSKTAILILAVLGMVQILFDSKITGAVIGSTEIPVSSFIGAITLLLSLLWFLIISKKKL